MRPGQARRPEVHLRISELKSFFTSDPVHRQLRIHFATLARHQTAYSYPDAFKGTDFFFWWYVTTYCELPGYEPSMPLHIMTRFCNIIEEALLFYVRTIYPYYMFIRGEDLSISRLEILHMFEQEDPRHLYIGLLWHFTAHDPSLMTGTKVERAIQARCEHGLLREEQAQLLELVVRKLFLQIETLLMSVEMVDRENEELVTLEMKRLIKRTNHSINAFFGSKRFRSERLEVLLMRYISDEEINWDVVKGLEIAQREVEERFPDWLGGDWRGYKPPAEDSEPDTND
ncbi:hypothetical protein BJ508DRAFT_312430 [Ascobolus immersus RN42]|uniref:Uncharacterized protein n=1 Tax=Ascobolus immersus RN42 TaxID=1160509 RepID=A0A3N4HZ36_ASCIM|nr:hypothetical protein BJ508DRAFT_312430 [Ascobolus immersus RN42]